MKRRRCLEALLATSLLAACSPRPPADGRTLLRVSAVTVPNTPWYEMWRRFGERLASAQAEIDCQLFIRSQLGSEEVALSNLRRGRVQMGGFSLQGAASVVPELNLILAPFLFDSAAEVDYVMDHWLSSLFAELLAARGLHFVQWAEVGWTHLYGKQPLVDPAQLAGQRMRSSTATGARLFAEAAGMDLISIPFPEVVPALQTGLIDGGQSGVGMYALAGIAREARHLSLTAHAFDTGLVLANRDWWRGMSAHRQGLVRAALDDVETSRRDVRAAMQQIESKMLAELGVSVHRPTPAQLEAWRQLAAPTHARLVEVIGGRAAEVYARIQAAKTAFRERCIDRERTDQAGCSAPVA